MKFCDVAWGTLTEDTGGSVRCGEWPGCCRGACAEYGGYEGR